MPYADPARAREAARERYARNKTEPGYMERRRTGQRRSYAKHRERYLPGKRDAKLCSTHGITRERLAELRSRANGLCELCGVGSGRLVIDHNHSSGAVRGLLCSGCNAGLHWAERPDWLAEANTYLRRFDGD